MVKRIRSRIQDVGFGTALWLLLFLLVPDARLLTPVFCQQPQAQSGQPIFSVNAKYVQGVGTGYWPTVGSGLTLNIAAGTVMCDQVATNYVGGTLTMAASQTNYLYLDQSNSCAPATNTTGFTDVHIPIASVTTNASSIIAVTDLRTWFNGGKNMVYNAARFPGADAEAKIAACHAALPSTGGTCDAREFQGAQTWGVTLIISKPVRLLLGHATFTYSGTGDMISIHPTATGPIIIEGQGPSVDTGSGTALINNSPTGSTINCQMPFGNGRLTLHRFRITSAVTGSNRVYGNAVNIDFGNNLTSVQATIIDVEALGHVFGVRVVQAIQLQIKGGRAAGFLDGYRIEGGTSSGLDSTYGQGSSRHNYCLTREFHGFPIWRASVAYSFGQFIAPKVNTTGHIYKCTTAGTTAGVEPTFPTGSGATVTDGGVVWTEFGLATQPGANQAGILQRWQASTAYSLNQVISPAQYNNSDYNDQPSTHLYKCTTAGTSAATEPTQSATIVAATGLARSGNVTTVTVTAALPSNFYVGNSVNISGAGDASFNGSWTITSVPTTTTFKFTDVAADLTVGGGTATVPGWSITSGGTVADGTVTWTEIGSARIVAFGPVYMTLKNTASDSAAVSGYKFEGASGTSLLGPGAEAIGGVSTIVPAAYWMLNSGVVISTPVTNIGPGTIDMYRIQGSALGTGGGSAVVIVAAQIQGNVNGFGVNAVNNTNVSTLVGPNLIAASNSPINDPSGKVVMLGGNGVLTSSQLVTMPIIIGSRGVVDNPTLPSGLTSLYATDTVGNPGPMLQLDRPSGGSSSIPFIAFSTAGNTTTIGSLEQSGAASGAMAIRSGTTTTPKTLSFFGTAVVFPTVTFSTLPSPTNGMVCYCSDCTIANPCAGGGTGAIAKRLNGGWVCN